MTLHLLIRVSVLLLRSFFKVDSTQCFLQCRLTNYPAKKRLDLRKPAPRPKINQPYTHDCFLLGINDPSQTTIKLCLNSQEIKSDNAAGGEED